MINFFLEISKFTIPIFGTWIALCLGAWLLSIWLQKRSKKPSAVRGKKIRGLK